MIFIFKQVGLGEALLEAETIEEQESPVNCFRKLFGKKHCVLYYFLGVREISGSVISEVRSFVHSIGTFYVVKFNHAFSCKTSKKLLTVCYLMFVPSDRTCIYRMCVRMK